MRWLKSLFTTPATPDPGEYQRLNAFLRGMLIFAITVTAIASLFLVSIKVGQTQILIINGVLLIFLFVAYFLQYRGLLRWSSLVLILVFWVYFTFSLAEFGGLHNPIVTGFLLLILVGGTLLGQTGVILTVTLSILSTLGVVLLEINGKLPPVIVNLSPMQHWISYTTTLLGTGVVLYLWQRSIQKAMAQARNELNERTRAEAALRAQENKLRSLLSAIPDVIIIFSADGTILELFTGQPDQMSLMGTEIIGKSIHRMMPNSVSQNIQLVIDNAIASGEVEEFQYNMPGISGMAWFEARVVAYEINSETQVIWLARNMTRQKNAEEKIIRFNAELEQRVRKRTAELEAAVNELEAFTYTVSHDLRSPLRGISGFTGILLNDFNQYLPEAGQEYLNKISHNSRKMGELIDDLLEFSRLGRKQVTKVQVNIAKLSQEVIEGMEHELAGRTIQFDIAETPPTFADAELMKRVLYNLLSNAVKFTRNQLEAKIEIGSFQKDGQDVYFIRDNGVGFDMNYTDKIFGVFQRLHEESQFEGTGVGLAIVQRAITRHGGRVWAESEVDKGATFYFTLPTQ